MFCQSNFIINKIFAFLNASIDWSKEIPATKTTFIYCISNILWLFLFDTMEIYANMLSYFHVAKLCGWFDLSQFLNKGMVVKAVPQ